MAVKNVIFDLDGTLLYTLQDLCNAVNFVLGKYGEPERSLSEVRSFVGNGVHKLMERSVPAGTSRWRRRGISLRRVSRAST